MKKFLRNLGILVGIVTAIIIIFNKIISITASKDDVIEEKERIYKWKYGNIYYTKSGSGAPLILIHDLNETSSSYEWNRVIKSLAKDRTVYAIDLIGCGKSEKPNITYTNYLFVQLLNEFIKKVVGHKVDVVATGDSLSFVIMACQMEKDLFNKIVGVTPTDLYELSKTPGNRKNILKYFIELPVLGTFIYNIATNWFFIKDDLKSFFSNEYLVSIADVKNYYANAHRGNGNGRYLMASIKAHYTNININTAVKNINNSVYLINGENDLEGIDICNDYISINPAIEAAYIPDAGSLPQLEAPQKFVSALKLLLETN